MKPVLYSIYLLFYILKPEAADHEKKSTKQIDYLGPGRHSNLKPSWLNGATVL